MNILPPGPPLCSTRPQHASTRAETTLDQPPSEEGRLHHELHAAGVELSRTERTGAILKPVTLATLAVGTAVSLAAALISSPPLALSGASFLLAGGVGAIAVLENRFKQQERREDYNQANARFELATQPGGQEPMIHPEGYLIVGADDFKPFRSFFNPNVGSDQDPPGGELKE